MLKINDNKFLSCLIDIILVKIKGTKLQIIDKLCYITENTNLQCGSFVLYLMPVFDTDVFKIIFWPIQSV